MRNLTLVVGVVLAFGCSKEYPVPRVQVTTPPSPQQDLVVLPFTLFDLDSLPADIDVQYSTDGTEWKDATPAPFSEPKTNLSTEPRGKAHAFVWDSRTDLGEQNFDHVYLRIRATTKKTGPWDQTESFQLNNHPLGEWSDSCVVDEGEQPAIFSHESYTFCTFVKNGDLYLTRLDYTSSPPSVKRIHPVTDTTQTESEPVIFVHDDAGETRIHIIYVKDDGTDKQIHWVSLTYDDGNDEYTPYANGRVDSDTNNLDDDRPKLAFDGTNIHIVWRRQTQSGWELRHTIVTKTSTSWGIGTQQDILVTNCASQPQHQLVWFPSDNRVWAVYIDAPDSGDIYARCFNTTTNSWEHWDTITSTSLFCDDVEDPKNIAVFVTASSLFVFFDDTNPANQNNGRDLFWLEYDGADITKEQLTDEEGDQKAAFITSFNAGELWLFWSAGNALWAGNWDMTPSRQGKERVDDDGSDSNKEGFCGCYATSGGGDYYLIAVWCDERTGTKEIRFCVRNP